jgi:hypothetical protein
MLALEPPMENISISHENAGGPLLLTLDSQVDNLVLRARVDDQSNLRREQALLQPATQLGRRDSDFALYVG